MARKYLLCFHDYSVWNFQQVTPIIENLKDLAGSPFCILVIPNTEGASAETIENFKKTLVRLDSEGFELALHGFKHKAEFSQGRNYKGLIGMNLTHGEAEFAGLSEYESSRLLQAGLGAWNQLFGESNMPAAFVPPTWYSNKYLPGQVRTQNMVYEDRYSITTVNGKRFSSLVASFAGIPNFLTKTAFKFGEIILKIPVGLPRIAIHPTDFPKHEKAIHNLIRIALGSGRKLIQYRNI